MSTGTNAFWREVLDYIPGLVMLFRIDEQEQAHLIFVSDGVNDALGYEPEQYVLASEEQTIVKNDLEKLIDRVAELTHPDNSGLEAVCELTDRSGNILPWQFDYRLFRPKSSKVNLISVALHPVEESGNLNRANTGGNEGASEPALNGGSADGWEFVAGSPAMTMLMKQIEDLSKLRQNILLSGEKHTGKLTIAEDLAKRSSRLKSGTQVWVLDLEEMMSAGKKRIFAGLDESDSASTLFDDIESDLQLVIGEIALLKPMDQKDLIQAIETRTKRGYITRIVATSSMALDMLQSSKKLGSDFLYRMSFLSVIVPPLRDRGQDIIRLAHMHAERITRALGGKVARMDNVLEKSLLKQEWTGNIEELFKAVSIWVVTGETGKSKPGSNGVGKSQQGPVDGATGGLQFSEILPFDEMARRYIEMVLEKTGGRIYGKGGAAELLEMKPTTLQSRIKKLEGK